MPDLHFQKSTGLIEKVEDMSLAKAIYIFLKFSSTKRTSTSLGKKCFVSNLPGISSPTYVKNNMHVMWKIIYTLCKKQYVGKAETAFDLRLNNHRNDVKNPHPKTILACKHFQEKSHNSNKHAKFIITDKRNSTKKTLFKETTAESKH